MYITKKIIVGLNQANVIFTMVAIFQKKFLNFANNMDIISSGLIVVLLDFTKNRM
jgi:hypothetical protein